MTQTADSTQSAGEYSYPKQVLIAADQLVNTICGGWADETISSRSHRLAPESKWWAALRSLIDLLFFFDPDHCLTSYESEKLRRHLPPQLRQ